MKHTLNGTLSFKTTSKVNPTSDEMTEKVRGGALYTV